MESCAICGNTDGNQTHFAREMMFGLREKFRYGECGNCGCLQLLDVPADLGKYYPPEYYSFNEEPIETFSGVRKWLRRQKHEYALYGRNFIGRLLTARAGMEPHFRWMRGAKVGFDAAILDVGSGGGSYLKILRRDGFTNLTGIDPFLDADRTDDGIRLYKRAIADMEGAFDLILMNHAFEHTPDPSAVLDHVRRLLRPGRFALIRIPVADSYAWRTYGVDWVQLDAPRHLFLHTIKSMRLLAEGANLQMGEIIYDSFWLQFTGSERYKRDIPLFDKAGDSLFTEEEIAHFQAQAEELNAKGEGDQAGFFLWKPRE